MNKKIIFILLIIGIILISGCAKNYACTEREESCCKLGTCSKAEALCEVGSMPIFKGCDDVCNPIVACEYI